MRNGSTWNEQVDPFWNWMMTAIFPQLLRYQSELTSTSLFTAMTAESDQFGRQKENSLKDFLFMAHPFANQNFTTHSFEGTLQYGG